jgi:hypothetical protein
MGRRLVALGVAAGLGLAGPGLARGADREACFSAAESAQKLRAQGHLVESRERLRVCSQQSCPVAVRGDCTTWLSEVDAELPSIVVQARDAAGNDLSDVRVIVDGKTLTDHLAGLPLELDPGSHVLRFERSGAEPVQRSLIVVAGQKARVIEARMLAQGASPGAPDVAEGPAASPATATPGSSFWSTTPLPVLVLGGVAAAGLVGTAVFWTWGRVDYASLRGSCSPACSPSSVGGVRTKLVVGDVSLGVAAVALGIGAWLELTHGHAAPSDPKSATLVVQPQPGGGVVGLAGGF